MYGFTVYVEYWDLLTVLIDERKSVYIYTTPCELVVTVIDTVVIFIF